MRDHLTADLRMLRQSQIHFLKETTNTIPESRFWIVSKEKNLPYEDVEMILIGNHGPFALGKNRAKAVYNSKVLEVVAEMAYLTYK